MNDGQPTPRPGLPREESGAGEDALILTFPYRRQRLRDQLPDSIREALDEHFAEARCRANHPSRRGSRTSGGGR